MIGVKGAGPVRRAREWEGERHTKAVSSAREGHGLVGWDASERTRPLGQRFAAQYLGRRNHSALARFAQNTITRIATTMISRPSR
ncbi:hypothetical protein SALBM217S_02718 [Streptomyces griseoloalbus]